MPNRLGNNCTVAIKRSGMLSVPINRKVWPAFKKNHTLDTINKPPSMSQGVPGSRKSFACHPAPLITKPVSGAAPCWLRCCIRKGIPAKWSVRVPSRRPYNGLALPGDEPRSGFAVLILITNTEKKTGSVETMGSPTR